jgi:hypothetical protein
MHNKFLDIINTVFSNSNYNNPFLNFDFGPILYLKIVSVTFMTVSLVVKQKNISTKIK